MSVTIARRLGFELDWCLGLDIFTPILSVADFNWWGR